MPSQTIRQLLENLAHQAYLDAHAPGYTKLRPNNKKYLDEAEAAIDAKFREALGEKKDNKAYFTPTSYVGGWNARGDQALARWQGDEENNA